MEDKERFIKMKDIKTPAVLLFVAVYIFAVVIVLLKDPSNALAFIGMSMGMLFLTWLIIEITKKVQAPDFEIRKPGWELVFGLLILVVWDFAPLRYLYLSMVDGLSHLIFQVWDLASFPKLEFDDKWSVGFIFKKILLLVVLPFVFLRLRKNSLPSMGLATNGWKKNLTTGLIIFLAMAIPSAFYSDTASLVLGGKLSLSQIGVGSLASFTYSLFIAGFSEEFFFRAFIQTRFSAILKSKISGVLIASLLFGLLHISNIIHWYPGTTVAQAFCRAFFVQTFLGLVFGVLWARTRSLIPCVFVHTGVDGLNNLGHIISRFGI